MNDLREELNQAIQNFEYASKEYVEAATFALMAIEAKMSAYLREKKSNETI